MLIGGNVYQGLTEIEYDPNTRERHLRLNTPLTVTRIEATITV